MLCHSLHCLSSSPPPLSAQTGIYRAAHNQLLAHAAAVKVYRDKYQPTQKGRIGITLNSDYKQVRQPQPNNPWTDRR